MLFLLILMSEFKIFGMNFFDFTDFLTNQIMLPLGGIFIAIFVGWVMKKQDVLDELQIEDGIIFKCWFFVVRFVAPVMVGNGLNLLSLFNLFLTMPILFFFPTYKLLVFKIKSNFLLSKFLISLRYRSVIIPSIRSKCICNKWRSLKHI